jgi:Uma2 family endonuclease
MATAAFVSAKEYLETSWRPDCDYVDGEIVERNVGELNHAEIQSLINSWFIVRRKQLRIRSYVELRLRISDRRFRIPDVMVLSDEAPREQVVTTPPLLCVEVLSPGDSLRQIWARTQDYISIGVPACWIIDPEGPHAWTVTSTGMTEVTDGILRAGEIALPFSEISE